jgi:hypothetical protein
LEWDASVRRGDRFGRFLGVEYSYGAIVLVSSPRLSPDQTEFQGYEGEVVIPFGYFVVCGTVLPILWVRSSRARALRVRRQQFALCLHCGYDLRASSDKCPECGVAVSSIPAQI